MPTSEQPPQHGNKGGGQATTHVTVRPPRRRKGLLARLEDWFKRT